MKADAHRTLLPAMRSWLTPWGLCLILSTSNAWSSPELQTQLEQVRAERTRVEDHFDGLDRQCHQKLNVNDCRRDVQLARSEALRPIMVRQRELEAALRKERAQDQRNKAQERRESHEQRQRDRTPKPELPRQPPETPRQP
jgi:hypothetical protein